MPGRRRLIVHVVKAHTIDAEFRHAGGDFFRILVGRKARPEDGIDPEDSQTSAAFIKVAILRRHEAAASRGFVEQAAHIGDPRAGIVPGEHEGRKGDIPGSGYRRDGEQADNRK